MMGAEVSVQAPRQSPIPALIGLLTGVRFKFLHSDPIRYPVVADGRLIRFDRAVAFPPIGVRIESKIVEDDLYERFPERTQNLTVLATRHLLSQALNRVVLAVPNNLLFSPGAERALRRDLVERGILRAVIAMPAGLLLPYTGIAFSIVVLEPTGKHDEVRFVNADTPTFRENIQKSKVKLQNWKTIVDLALGAESLDAAATIPKSDIIANDVQLQVARYVLPDSKKRLLLQLAASPTITLSELVSSVRPMATTSDQEDVIEAIEVGAVDLPPYGYIQNPGKVVKVASDVAAKSRIQFLKPYDIVLIIKGTVGKVGIVPPDVPPSGHGGWIAGQSATVLRLNEDAVISAPVLAMQLRSPLGQGLLSSIVSGATIPLIRLNELLRLKLLMPTVELTERATLALEEEANLQRKIDELRSRQAAQADDLWTLGLTGSS
ncbi:hypothetical protein CCP2SC5_810005 [Azospirillaceae bacterium]